VIIMLLIARRDLFMFIGHFLKMCCLSFKKKHRNAAIPSALDVGQVAIVRGGLLCRNSYKTNTRYHTIFQPPVRAHQESSNNRQTKQSTYPSNLGWDEIIPSKLLNW
jgi:hypothetical protein